MITIKVLSVIPGQPGTTTHELPADADLMGLKVDIFNQTGVQPEMQRLISMGKELVEDDKSLTELQLIDGISIHLAARRESLVAHQSIPINPPQNQPPQYGYQQLQPGYNAMPYQQQYQQQHPNQLHPNPPLSRRDIVDRVIELSKFVQIFAALDTAFVAFLSFWKLYWLMVGIVATISGYLGARHLKRPYIALYGFFILAYMGVRIYLITIYTDVLSVIIGIMILVIEPYIFRLVWMLFMLIPHLTDEEKRTILQHNRQASLFSE